MVPARARLTLGALSATLLGGVVGLGWWFWHHRSGSRPGARLRRVRVAVVAAALVIIAVGTVWRLTIAIQPVRGCSPPGGRLTSTRSGAFDASTVAQKAATWPETGIGLLYARADGAQVCLSRSADYYVAVHSDNIAGARAMNMGDIVLTPGFDTNKEHLAMLAAHEARHRRQWAVGTVIAGPFAFPVAYAIDDFFFPGARNQFERQAGLESGGYRRVGTGPVLGAPQITVLSILAMLIVLAVVRARHRRAAAGSHARADDGRRGPPDDEQASTA